MEKVKAGGTLFLLCIPGVALTLYMAQRGGCSIGAFLSTGLAIVCLVLLPGAAAFYALWRQRLVAEQWAGPIVLLLGST